MLLQAIYWGSKSWTVCRSGAVRFIAQISYALYLYYPLARELIHTFHIPFPEYDAMLLTLLMPRLPTISSSDRSCANGTGGRKTP